MINFNGKTYESVDDMPPDVRREYEEAMRLLNKAKAELSESGEKVSKTETKTLVSTRIEIDGKEYSSPDEMPPDVRERYESLMKEMAKIAQGMMPTDSAAVVSAEPKNDAAPLTSSAPISEPVSRPVSAPPIQSSSPVIKEERASIGLLVAAAVVILLLLALGFALVLAMH